MSQSSDAILDIMEARINNLLPIYRVDKSEPLKGNLFPIVPKLPDFPFFVQLKTFLGCGHLSFGTIVEHDVWTLHAFCMAWTRQEIDNGKVKELYKDNLKEEMYVMLKNGNSLIRAMITEVEPLTLLDLDEGSDAFIKENSKFYEMPQEGFSVPLMSLQIQIDKTQNFSSTDLVYQAFQRSRMQMAVFSAVPVKTNKEFVTLSLLTPTRENLGDILVKEMCELLQIPIPTVPTLVSITHYTESGHVFYQVPAHYPQVFKLVEDFDLLVRREIATIRALIPDYSGEKEVRERLICNEKEQGGHMFAALYSQDGRWYRARVVNYVEGDEDVHMIFIDYGNDEIVKVNDILLLDEFDSTARELPAMARRMRLKDVDNMGDAMDDLLGIYSVFSMICVQMNGEWMAEVSVNVEDDPKKPENKRMLKDLLQ